VSQLDLPSDVMIEKYFAGPDIQCGTIDISPPATNCQQPEPRSVCFTPGGSLVIAYLEHGIMYVAPDFNYLHCSPDWTTGAGHLTERL